MRLIAIILLLSLTAYSADGIAQSGVPPEARAAYDRQHWEQAIELLRPASQDPASRRMLALALYQQQNSAEAIPALQAELIAAPDDIELLEVLLELLVGTGRYQEALPLTIRLVELGNKQSAELARARIYAAEGRHQQAIGRLEPLIDASDVKLAQQAAALLINLLQSQDQFERAYQIARRAIGRDPDSFYAFQFDRIEPLSAQASRRWLLNAGYRLEYDDNVGLLPDDAGLVFGNLDEEDFRHVVYADLVYEKLLSGPLEFYAEAHFSQSLHQSLDDFNLTRINAVTGLGWSADRWGWRLPIEVTHDRFDGDEFRTNFDLSPGIFLKFGSGFYLHAYARLTEQDYDQTMSIDEDRSGDASHAGVVLAGRLGERWRIRSRLEVGEVDTDGRNWRRDESEIYLFGEFNFRENWFLGLGGRYEELDFDQLHSVYLDLREDESTQLFAVLRHQFRNQWQLRLQVSAVDHESSLAVYDYERNVISLGVSHDF